MARDVWADGTAYERYMGRWSAPVAARFVDRLGVGAGRRWLDVGCGTGRLSAAVLAAAAPDAVLGVDPSAAFVAAARSRVPGAGFAVSGAAALPVPDGRFDAVVGGLMLNFVPDAAAAVAEFARAAAPGGAVAAYVWDYADGMEMLRRFWDAAAAVDPAATGEAQRFPMCRPEPLHALWTGAGLGRVTVESIEVPTVFADTDDFWDPFLAGQGPAPSYVTSLDAAHRAALRARLDLPVGPDGTIALTARAWMVQGRRS